MKTKIIIIIMLIITILEAGVITILLYERNNIIKDRDYLANSYNSLKQNNNANRNYGNKENNSGVGKNDNISVPNEKNEITDWRLTLVNHKNTLSENFNVELSKIDNIRKFDSRAIGELKQMMLDMKAQKVTGVWIQSSYRSIESQQEVFSKQVEEYMKERKNKRKSRRVNT